MNALAQRADRLASSMAVRTFLPAFFLVFHVVVLSALAKERFSIPFNSAPGAAPGFVNPAIDPVPTNWSRLIVSRWDSQHYITIGLRGYKYCAPREELGPDHYPDSDLVCQLNFFPGYAFVGGWVSRLLHVPIDYALFGVSLFTSYLAMVLWTSKEIVSALGGLVTLSSLVLLNFFTTGYELITLQTEPPSLMLTLATFVLLERRRLLPAALCAGAAAIVRPTGIAVSAAFGLAVLWKTYRERPNVGTILLRALYCAVAAWGLILLFVFFQVRFGDALVYAHARERYYHYLPNPLAVFTPSYKWLAQSLWAAPNEGMWLAAGLLWFALGHRSAFAGFSTTGKIFWYAIYAITVGISLGQVSLGFSGMSRYMLLAVPMFFAMAAAMKRTPAAFVLWVIICLAHYWSVNACFYVGRGEPGFWQICHIQPGA
jgi:hypothetical protein